MKSSPELKTLGQILTLLKRIHFHPAYFVVAIALSLSAAAFEGVGIGMLIPILNGFLQTDYSFIKELPVLGDVIAWLPERYTARDRSLFIVLMSLFAGVTIFKNVLRYCASMSMYYLALRATHHLRKELFNRYLSFGKLYFDRTNIGHHSNVLSLFCIHAFGPLRRIDKFVNAFFSITVYVILMSLISWKLTAFALPLFAVLHVVVRWMLVLIEKLSHAITDAANVINKKTLEILTLIPLVKAYNTEREERDHYREISLERTHLEFRIAALRELVRPFQELITLIAVLSLLSGMLYIMIRDGQQQAPAFIVYFYLVLNAASKFSTLTSFRSVLAEAAGPVSEVSGVFDDEDKIFVPDGKQECKPLEQAIAFKNLTFSYTGEREELSNVSFTVDKGSMTAIVGPTGSGKTTLSNLLLRFYDCQPGTIFYDGTDIREFSTASLRQQCALVSQETLLMHDSLANNITYGVDAVSDEQLQSVVERSRLQEFVDKLPEGLDTLIGDRGVKLSGGEKQRVSIARALLKDSDILILDEATSSLDSTTEKLIQEAIDEARKGKTAIVIAHRLSTIKNADKIVVVDGGVSVEQGTLQELLDKKGKFYELWEEQKFD